MFLEARQWLQMMLVALAVQIGALAKVGARKGYRYKYGNLRQLRQVKNDFKQELKSSLDGPAVLPLDDLTNYQLGLTGEFEPASNLPTINLPPNFSLGQLQQASRGLGSKGKTICP